MWQRSHYGTPGAVRAGAGSFDLILAIGDERTDEDMFEVLQKSPHCFTCTVGCKVSRAQYHVEDSDEVLRVLEVLGAVSSEAASAPSAASGGAAAVGMSELEA